MKEIDYSNQEVQRDVSNFYITLLSGEIIEMPCLMSEDMTQTRDDTVTICLESATCTDRLYQAFKNKELVQFIKKESIYKNVTNAEAFNREFSYDYYFKISEFCTRLDNDRCAVYNITFESV